MSSLTSPCSFSFVTSNGAASSSFWSSRSLFRLVFLSEILHLDLYLLLPWFSIITVFFRPLLCFRFLCLDAFFHKLLVDLFPICLCFARFPSLSLSCVVLFSIFVSFIFPAILFSILLLFFAVLRCVIFLPPFFVAHFFVVVFSWFSLSSFLRPYMVIFPLFFPVVSALFVMYVRFCCVLFCHFYVSFCSLYLMIFCFLALFCDCRFCLSS